MTRFLKSLPEWGFLNFGCTSRSVASLTRTPTQSIKQSRQKDQSFNGIVNFGSSDFWELVNHFLSLLNQMADSCNRFEWINWWSDTWTKLSMRHNDASFSSVFASVLSWRCWIEPTNKSCTRQKLLKFWCPLIRDETQNQFCQSYSSNGGLDLNPDVRASFDKDIKQKETS